MTEIIIAFVAVLAGLIAGLLIGNMQCDRCQVQSNEQNDNDP